ncbi:hypothetical protein HY628_00610 [Candidatus Uhrbacteria bacterium]|nr:hypothetical protein [Candidatus Uhrbacteria bacterium]
MASLLQKIISMARKTGHRCIIVDSVSEEAFVLMDFVSYERMLGNGSLSLTTPLAADKIEPEIAPPPAAENHPQKLSEERLLEDERFYLEPID